MENTKDEVVLEECLVCTAPVHEIAENTFACDACKSIFAYDGRSWINKSEKKTDPLNFLPKTTEETTIE